jgi:hypothetical protein
MSGDYGLHEYEVSVSITVSADNADQAFERGREYILTGYGETSVRLVDDDTLAPSASGCSMKAQSKRSPRAGSHQPGA